jgi:TonB-linked SusC/RagA family outer membrane protein
VQRLRVLLVPLSFLVLFPAAALAQRRVTGRVTAQDTGEPLGSSTISIVGTALGTVTNEEGTFSLTVPEGSASVLVRRIGYKRRTIPLAAGENTLTVALERDVLQLETQVVTGAATSVSRRNAANDVASVSADELSKVPAPSIENALAGRIAGAQVIANSGAPGGGNQIRLRGVTSVFGSADPLYVVDGVIASNDAVQPGTNAISAANRNTSNSTNQDNGVNRIADLNPADIESVEILKGASASAIYGSKASNGVVIIKTKSGTGGGRPVVNVVQRFGTVDLSGKFGARRFTLAEAEAHGATKGLSQAVVDQNYAQCNGFCDFEEELFGEHPLNFETSISVRGGSGNTSYFVSGINKYDGGIEKNTDYRKQGVRLNLTQLIGSRLSLQVNNNLIRTITRRGISNNDNANITPYFVMAGTPSYFYQKPDASGNYPTNPFTTTNPFQNRDFIDTPEEVYRLLSAVNATYSAITTERQTLQLRIDGGIDRFNQQDNIVSPRFLFFEGNDGLPGTVTSLSGNVLNANVNASVVHSWFPASQLFTATTSAGVQREIADRRSTNVVTRDVLAGQENINRGAASQLFANREKVRGLAFFGQEEVLALDERLLVTAGARAERSTVNGDIKKFFLFPKGSVSFRFPGLGRFTDEFKLRAAVGQSGNQPLYIQKYQPALIGTYQGQNAVLAGLLKGNPDIKPERQTEIEGGFDATLLNSRASLSFTVYQKTISDVILHVTSGPSTGYDVEIRNGGTIRNRGTEVLLALTPFETPAFNWISRMTFARNVGIVTKLPLPAGQTFFNIERDATGQRVAFGAGYGVGRLEVGKKVTQIVAADKTPAGVDTVVQKGDAAPDFTMGFSNEFTWRGFRVSSLFDWQKGGDLVNITQNVYDGGGLAPDQPDGGAARANKNDAQGISQYVYDASFVKLREVSVGYEIPTRFTSRLLRGSNRARLEFSGRNLYTWTDYPGVDPEVSNFGSQQISRFIDLAPYPPSRSYFFTIDLTY